MSQETTRTPQHPPSDLPTPSVTPPNPPLPDISSNPHLSSTLAGTSPQSLHASLVALGAAWMGGIEELAEEVRKGEEQERKLEAAASSADAQEILVESEEQPSPDLAGDSNGVGVATTLAGEQEMEDSVPTPSGETARAGESKKGKEEQLSIAPVPSFAIEVGSGEAQTEQDAGDGIGAPEESFEQRPLSASAAVETDEVGVTSTMAVEQPPALPLDGTVEPLESSAGVDKGEEQSSADPLDTFWQENVSRFHPPKYWFFRDPPSSSAQASSHSPSPIGCTLTFHLLDSSTRVFTVPTSAGCSSVVAAQNAAASLVLASSDLLEQAKQLRLEVGGEDAEQELAEARVEALERPYEVLVERSQQWMASGDMRWEYHSDELNQTFGCTLHIPISTSSLLSYTSDKIYTSHSSARDAAASKALADDVPGKWEAAYEERFCVDGKGYIKLSMSSPVVEAGKEDTAEQSERVDAVAFLQHECWSALGGITKWIRWRYQASPQLSSSGTTTSTSLQPLVSASLSITLPPSSANPASPSPLVYSVPAHYLTKHAAFSACASAALKDGIVEMFRAIKAERAAEAEKKREERGKEAAERKARPLPIPGSVKWPVDYLNTCAQRWTGNGQPLKFEELVSSDGPVELFGFSLSVYITSTLTKVYTISPSEATPTRRSAKYAVVRLALRERVLDLLQPDLELTSTRADADGEAEKQRIWGVELPPDDTASPMKTPQATANARGEATKTDEDEGESEAVSTLLDGAQAVYAQLGLSSGLQPQYLVTQKDSLFEAAVSIPLSSSLSDTCTFRVPPVFSSPSHARTGAAEAALRAGALDILESRTRVAVLKSTAPTQREGDRGRGRKRYVPVERSLVEQEEVHQKTYGGFGEAMAVATGLQKKKGKSVLALEAYCLSRSLPPPVFTTSPSISPTPLLPDSRDGQKHSISVVVQGLRFELPQVPEKAGEDRLAAQVLRHLQKSGAGEKQTGVDK